MPREFSGTTRRTYGAITIPNVQPRNWLADAHHNHARARELQDQHHTTLHPTNDPLLTARADRYMDHTPAAALGWDGGAWAAALTDRREGRI